MEKLLSEIRQKISESISVSHQLVVFAKDFIVKNTDKDPSQLIEEFIRSQGCKKVDSIIIKNKEIDNEDIKNISKYISCAYACEAALWDLINGGILLPGQGFQPCLVINPKVIRYITESNFETKSLNHGDSDFCKYTYPAKIKTNYLLKDKGFITDFDLFLNNLSINNAAKEVKEAISDCISCFKKDLYRPAATMLGKAVEGAWVELAISISTFVKDEKVRDKLIKLITEDQSFPKLVKKVVEVYADKAKFEHIWKASIRDELQRSAYLFTDVVRDSRNAIHFQYKPAIANSYEKIAVLLLNFSQNIQPLYKLKALLDREKNNSNSLA